MKKLQIILGPTAVGKTDYTAVPVILFPAASCAVAPSSKVSSVTVSLLKSIKVLLSYIT